MKIFQVKTVINLLTKPEKERSSRRLKRYKQKNTLCVYIYLCQFTGGLVSYELRVLCSVLSFQHKGFPLFLVRVGYFRMNSLSFGLCRNVFISLLYLEHSFIIQDS